MEKKYLSKIIANDNEGLQMISACCAGAEIKVSEIKYLQKNSIKLLSTNAQLMMTQFDRTADEAFKSTDDVHKRMSEFYKEDGQEFFAKTGEYIRGTPLQGDLNICKELVQMIQ